MLRGWQWCGAVMVSLVLLGCGQQGPPPKPSDGGGGGNGGYGGYGGYGADPLAVQFDDAAQTNTTTNVALKDLSFTDAEGREIAIKDYLGEKNVVLVFTRGYTSGGGCCLYCSTQTSRLVTNYEKFKQHGAEVVVVFPVRQGQGKQQLEEFLQSATSGIAPNTKPPFPVLLDVKLAAVNQLGIKDDVSKPATYILDKNGSVRFAHVGATMIDRPSIKAMLTQLDALE